MQSQERNGEIVTLLSLCHAELKLNTNTLNTLRENFPSQMYLAGNLSGVATPIIAGDKANLERGKQTQQAAACLIVARAKGIGNNTFSFGIKGIPKPMSIVFVADIGPLLIEFTDKRDII